MTRYAMDKVLWRYGQDSNYRAAFNDNPGVALANEELEDRERAALLAKDVREIFSLGAHPFLVYSFAIQANGGWSFQFMHDYVERLKGLELQNIET